MNEWIAEHGWIVFGSVAGSLVASVAARNMSIAGRIETLVVGTLFGCFVGPGVREIWFSGYDPAKSSVPATVCFMCGLVALPLVPVIIKWAKKVANNVPTKVVPTGASDDAG